MIKTYEQERDEAAYEYNHFIHERLGFKAGADWANARAEKVNENKNKRISTLEKVDAVNVKMIAARDAIIEKLEKLTHLLTDRLEPGEEVNVYWPISQRKDYTGERSGRAVVKDNIDGALNVEYIGGGTNFVCSAQCRRLGVKELTKEALAELNEWRNKND